MSAESDPNESIPMIYDAQLGYVTADYYFSGWGGVTGHTEEETETPEEKAVEEPKTEEQSPETSQ